MVTELVLSEEVPLGTETCVSFVPPEGNVYLYEFISEAPISLSAVAKVVWKLDDENEDHLNG